MHKKKLALSQILWIIVSVFVFAFFGTGAVYAYNANLRLNLPVIFQVSACKITFRFSDRAETISDGAETILYDSLSDSPTINANVKAVEKDVLEYTYTCPASPVYNFQFSVTNSMTLQLVGITVYGEDVDLSSNLITITSDSSNNVNNLSIELESDNSGITLAKDDKIIFQIKVLKVSEI